MLSFHPSICVSALSWLYEIIHPLFCGDFFQVQLQVLELKYTPAYLHCAHTVMSLFPKRTGSNWKASIEMCLELKDLPSKVGMLYMRHLAEKKT